MLPIVRDGRIIWVLYNGSTNSKMDASSLNGLRCRFHYGPITKYASRLPSLVSGSNFLFNAIFLHFVPSVVRNGRRTSHWGVTKANRFKSVRCHVFVNRIRVNLLIGKEDEAIGRTIRSVDRAFNVLTFRRSVMSVLRGKRLFMLLQVLQVYRKFVFVYGPFSNVNFS